MDVLCEKLEGPQGEKFAIRLAKSRQRACVDIGVVKAVKSAEKLLNKEFPHRDVQEEQLTEGPIPSWVQEEVRNTIGKRKLKKAAGPEALVPSRASSSLEA
ncbi:unnamed protein product [Heligmosomoides polygyrus]|uniref:THUMP domain-containing protein n=1 Tax=Heligmosomoides polygyrus TaxID=6339 RepID=A0A183GB87_HELPZ|nr:unnamed protein product [Heligmosomoides polygyrus]